MGKGLDNLQPAWLKSGLERARADFNRLDKSLRLLKNQDGKYAYAMKTSLDVYSDIVLLYEVAVKDFQTYEQAQQEDATD